MKQKLGWIIGLLLIAAPAYAQEITIDYDHDFDFAKATTFTYIDTKETNPADAAMGEHIKNAIIKAATESGLKQVDSDGDLFITYHLTVKDSDGLDTSGFSYGGVGTGWGAWGSDTGASKRTYTQGTLIVDAYEPGDKKIVWRSSGAEILKTDPGLQTEKMEKIVADMGKKWAKMMAKKEKEEAKK